MELKIKRDNKLKSTTYHYNSHRIRQDEFQELWDEFVGLNENYSRAEKETKRYTIITWREMPYEY